MVRPSSAKALSAVRFRPAPPNFRSLILSVGDFWFKDTTLPFRWAASNRLLAARAAVDVRPSALPIDRPAPPILSLTESLGERFLLWGHDTPIPLGGLDPPPRCASRDRCQAIGYADRPPRASIFSPIDSVGGRFFILGIRDAGSVGRTRTASSLREPRSMSGDQRSAFSEKP